MQGNAKRFVYRFPVLSTINAITIPKLLPAMTAPVDINTPATAARFDVLTATASHLEKSLANGELTSEHLVAEYLQQIERRYNGYLHAVISTPPRDKVLDLARELDQERSAGRARSPLHGIPVLVKDNIATHPDLGMETTAGTYALVGSVVQDNAPCIAQVWNPPERRYRQGFV